MQAIRRRAAAVQPRRSARSGATLKRYEIPYKGRLLAWDPVARKPRWTVEYGAYWNGGTLATAGNLVFQGTAAGDFIAYNATTGEKLWSSWADTGIVAPPITYSIDGQQYVSVMAGWGGAFPKKHVSYGRLLTFAIGGTATLPSKPRPRTRHRDREQRHAAADRRGLRSSMRLTAFAATAARRFFRTCAARRRRCSTGLEKILDGALVERGMPRFAEFDKAMTAELRALSARRAPEARRRSVRAGGHPLQHSAGECCACRIG